MRDVGYDILGVTVDGTNTSGTGSFPEAALDDFGRRRFAVSGICTMID